MEDEEEVKRNATFTVSVFRLEAIFQDVNLRQRYCEHSTCYPRQSCGHQARRLACFTVFQRLVDMTPSP